MFTGNHEVKAKNTINTAKTGFNAFNNLQQSQSQSALERAQGIAGLIKIITAL